MEELAGVNIRGPHGVSWFLFGMRRGAEKVEEAGQMDFH